MAGRLGNEFRDRTKQYALEVLKVYSSLPRSNQAARTLGRQFLRSGTSVAAHVREASRARSPAEFVSKLGGALQEADESALWLELLTEGLDLGSDGIDALLAETNELIAIMTTMVRRTKEKTKN